MRSRTDRLFLKTLGPRERQALELVDNAVAVILAVAVAVAVAVVVVLVLAVAVAVVRPSCWSRGTRSVARSARSAAPVRRFRYIDHVAQCPVCQRHGVGDRHSGGFFPSLGVHGIAPDHRDLAYIIDLHFRNGRRPVHEMVAEDVTVSRTRWSSPWPRKRRASVVGA